MAQLYTDGGDPLDGLIAAVQGIGQGAVAFQDRRRRGKHDQQEEDDRLLRRRLALRGDARAQRGQDLLEERTARDDNRADFSAASQADYRDRRAQLDREKFEATNRKSERLARLMNGEPDPEHPSTKGADGFFDKQASSDVPPSAEKFLSEALPLAQTPGERESVKAKAKDMARKDHLKTIGTTIDRHTLPEAPPGEKGAAGADAEQDPMLFMPKAKADELRETLKGLETPQEIDYFEHKLHKQIDDHATEISQQEHRLTVAQQLDETATQRSALAAQSGGAMSFDPIAYEQARKRTHMLRTSQLSGAALAREQQAITKLLYQPAKTDSGKGAGGDENLAAAKKEAMAAWKGLAQPERTIENYEALVKRFSEPGALDQIGQDMGTAAQQPAGLPFDSGGPQAPGWPMDAAKQPAQVAPQVAPQQAPQLPPEQAQGLERTKLVPQAKAAGWSKAEWIKFVETGEQPAGKPLR